MRSDAELSHLANVEDEATGEAFEVFRFTKVGGRRARLFVDYMAAKQGVAEALGSIVGARVGVGFLARPLGAAIFGHYGDRVGRKAMLVMTIVIMGLGTFLIGLLPTYRAGCRRSRRRPAAAKRMRPPPQGGYRQSRAPSIL